MSHADIKAAHAVLDRLLLYIYIHNDWDAGDGDYDLQHIQVEVLEAYEALEAALADK
jgi:hypothetical protein